MANYIQSVIIGRVEEAGIAVISPRMIAEAFREPSMLAQCWLIAAGGRPEATAREQLRLFCANNGLEMIVSYEAYTYVFRRAR